MSDTKQGNMFGTKPVVGAQSDDIGAGGKDGTIVTLLKRLLNRSGLGAFDFGFDGGYDVYNDKSKKEIYEIEKHFHNRERWFGLAGTPVGEIHRADEMDGVIGPFILLSGNSDFGAWVQLFGSDDTPFETGRNLFDGHRYLVTDVSLAGEYVIQLVAGESEDIPNRMANKEYTTTPFTAATTANDAGIAEVMSIRVPAGQKVWARVAAVGQNAKTIAFYVGIHEYIY